MSSTHERRWIAIARERNRSVTVIVGAGQRDRVNCGQRRRGTSSIDARIGRAPASTPSVPFDRVLARYSCKHSGMLRERGLLVKCPGMQHESDSDSRDCRLTGTLLGAPVLGRCSLVFGLGGSVLGALVGVGLGGAFYDGRLAIPGLAPLVAGGPGVSAVVLGSVLAAAIGLAGGIAGIHLDAPKLVGSEPEHEHGQDSHEHGDAHGTGNARGTSRWVTRWLCRGRGDGRYGRSPSRSMAAGDRPWTVHGGGGGGSAAWIRAVARARGVLGGAAC